MKKYWALLTLTAAICDQPTLALSATLQKEGRMDFYHCMTGKWADIYSTADLQAGYAHENFASTLSNIPGSPFDQMGAHCAPLYFRQGGNIKVDGYCKYSDADGHIWIMRFADRIVDGVSNGSFESVAGTGKFEGATIRGEIASANGFPPPAQPGMFNRCTRVTGTYKLK